MSFQEYWARQQRLLPPTSAREPIARLLAGTSVPHSKQERFAAAVEETANSKDVVTEVSDAIGEPRSHETEDEFVRRATAQLRAILLRRFRIAAAPISTAGTDDDATSVRSPDAGLPSGSTEDDEAESRVSVGVGRTSDE